MRLSKFHVALLIVELTPGPNMAYLASLTVTRGRRAGVVTVAGVAAGLACYGVLSALGLTVLIADQPFLYELLRWAGVCYLPWLACLTNMLNPKAALFYIAVLPNFVDQAAGSVLAQNLVLVGVSVAVATTVHGLIVLLAAQAQPYLLAGTRQRTLRRAMAAALALVAGWIAWQTRR